MSLSTGVKALDGLFGGSIPQGAVSGLFGEPNLGKSVFTAQLALSCNGLLKKPAAIVETEGMDYTLWFQHLSKRFGVKPDVDVIQSRGVESLTRLFGYETTLPVSEAGKIMAKIRPSGSPSPMAAKAKARGYGLIAVDSLSNPIKTRIPTERENLPARASIENILFGALQVLSEATGAAVFLTHHVSEDPINPRDAGRPWGGPILMFNSKYLLQIRKADSPAYQKYGSRARRFLRERYPGLERSEPVAVVLEKDWGFKDP